MTTTRISNEELAEICDRNGFPSVGDTLASGASQAVATAYMLGSPDLFYDDGEGRWLYDYVKSLQDHA